MVKKTKNPACQPVGLKTKTKISKLLVICLAVIILSAIGAWGIRMVLAVWSEPAGAPPGNMPSGPVLLQTTTPETPQTGNINVSGSIIGGSITGNPLCIGSACRTTWPTYTAGTGINILGTVISNTGDLSNTNEIQNVITNKGLQRDVSNNFGIINCSIGQIIKYDSIGKWVCASDEIGVGGGGDITAVTAGNGLQGGGLSGDVTLNVNTGYFDNNYIKNTTTQQLPANFNISGRGTIGDVLNVGGSITNISGINNFTDTYIRGNLSIGTSTPLTNYQLCLNGVCKTAWPEGGGGGDIWRSNAPYSPRMVYPTDETSIVCLTGGAPPLYGCSTSYKLDVGGSIRGYSQSGNPYAITGEESETGGTGGVRGSGTSGIGGYFTSRNDSALKAEQYTTLARNNTSPTAWVYRNFNLGSYNATAPVLLVEDNTASTGHLQEWKKQGNTKAIIDKNGNFGIGITTPTQKLEINGGIRLNTFTSQPSCNVLLGGTLWFTQGGGTTKDKLEVCAKDGSGSYSWRLLY